MACDPEKLFRKTPVIDNMIVDPKQVNPYDTVYAEVVATNPEEGALSYQWSVLPDKGTFIDPIDGVKTRWVAPRVGDDYIFNVKVSNSYKSANKTESVKVIVTDDPIVQIIHPNSGDYYVQLNQVEIKATASHSNGISKVLLYVNDVYKSENGGTASNQYNFTFTPDTSLLGETEIKIEAVARLVSTIGADSLLVNIEGILPGK